jgi:hypothetical protein
MSDSDLELNVSAELLCDPKGITGVKDHVLLAY